MFFLAGWKINRAFRKCTLSKAALRRQNRNHYPLHWLWCKDQCTAQHLSDQFSLCWWWVTSSRVQMAIWAIKYLERVKHIINPWCHLTAEASFVPSFLMEDTVLRGSTSKDSYPSSTHHYGNVCAHKHTTSFYRFQSPPEKTQDCLKSNQLKKT